MIPAVILSSHTVGLGVIRALGTMGVPVIVFYYDKRDMGYVSKFVKEKVFVPHPEIYEDQFIDLLITRSSGIGRSVLIPADDATLSVVSKYKDVLERHYIVACTGWDITERYIDKKYTYALAEEIGVPTPKTRVPKSIDDVRAYAEDIEFPCLVKPCQSHRYYELFKKKMVRVHDIRQMISAFKEAEDVGIEVMLHEFIPGNDREGVNYNSYCWDGEHLLEFTAEKVRLAPPEFGVPRVVISKDIPEIIEPGRKILQAMGYYGYSCTEFKRDIRDGTYKLMEVNGRHNRSTLLAMQCGINFPWIEYNHLTRNELPVAHNYQKGVYWVDDIRDVFHSVKSFHKERYSLMQYVRPYIKPHVFSIFALKDIKPFLKRCLDLVSMALTYAWSFVTRRKILNTYERARNEKRRYSA